MLNSKLYIKALKCGFVLRMCSIVAEVIKPRQINHVGDKNNFNVEAQ